jgi:hypothetical protein
MGVKLSLTLREERRLKVFENRVLRGIYAPKRDEIIRDWRKLHNEELRNFCSYPNRMTNSKRWVAYEACMRQKRGIYKCFGVKT